MSASPSSGPSRFRWLKWSVALCVIYVLSIGPVLGLAFTLREKTGWNGFYWAMLPYVPLLAVGKPGTPIYAYTEWWVVNVFHTVGPG